MRLTLLTILLSLSGIQCIENTCHPGPACDPNAQLSSNAQVVGTDCGTFTVGHNTIVNPNAAICAKHAFDANTAFTVTYKYLVTKDDVGETTNIDVYEAASPRAAS